MGVYVVLVNIYVVIVNVYVVIYNSVYVLCGDECIRAAWWVYTCVAVEGIRVLQARVYDVACKCIRAVLSVYVCCLCVYTYFAGECIRVLRASIYVVL